MNRRRFDGFEWVGYLLLFIATFAFMVALWRLARMVYYRGDLGAAILAVVLLSILTLVAYWGEGDEEG